MEPSNQIPSLTELALQYGTINNEQYSHIHRLSALKAKEGHVIGLDKLLLTHKFATGYQIGLLKLIQEYLIIKKRGEAFGKIAIDKGFATQEDIDKALDHQKKEFKRAKIKKLIGDILVASGVITVKQKTAILTEQVLLDTQAEKIFSKDLSSETGSKDDRSLDAQIALSDYEIKFLQIQLLDKEFAASVIEKGLASEREVRIAQKVQEEAFEKDHQIQTLGEFMVQLNFLTEDQKDLILKEQERIEAGDPIVPDTGIRICISPDKMEAVVNIRKDVKPISVKDIIKALETRGIKYGIYPDTILQCNLDMGNTEFIAARQDFSVELVKNMKATYHFDTNKIDSESKKMGATLAEQHLGGEVYLKKDLFGENIEQPSGYDFTFRCASGTRLSKDRTKAFAGKTGFPSLSVERKLYIHPFITVLEDADLRYGPLESYANLKISGILTGAYPVTAGDIEAREIRGAQIEAMGCIRSQMGITDSVIHAQGDIYASYLHHCRIETFGNVYIENEIIDSQVFCSGKLDSGQCRVIASTLYGKKGIELAGAGSSRTAPCVLGAGTEHHLLEKVRQITAEIKNITRALDELREKKDEQTHFSNKLFQKMIELKIFHDRAKNKKQTLANEFKTKKESIKKESLKNIIKLVQTFEKRMEASISSLKELNKTKKKYDREILLLEKKIQRLEPKIERKISDLQLDLLACFNWARKQKTVSHIKINKQAFPGTMFKGAFSSLKIETDLNNVSIFEKQNPAAAAYELVAQKNQDLKSHRQHTVVNGAG